MPPLLSCSEEGVRSGRLRNLARVRALDNLRGAFDNSPVGYERLVESQIQDAIASGAFSNLPGEGRPLQLDESARFLSGDDWLGNKILRDNHLLPEWLELAREVERLRQGLDELDGRHAELVELIAANNDWERADAAIEHLLQRYECHAHALRARQDELNVKAPGIRSERPGIWVEHEMERLRARADAARTAHT